MAVALGVELLILFACAAAACITVSQRLRLAAERNRFNEYRLEIASPPPPPPSLPSLPFPPAQQNEALRSSEEGAFHYLGRSLPNKGAPRAKAAAKIELAPLKAESEAFDEFDEFADASDEELRRLRSTSPADPQLAQPPLVVASTAAEGAAPKKRNSAALARLAERRRAYFQPPAAYKYFKGRTEHI